MARGIELDWIVVRINTAGKIIAVGLTVVVAAGLLWLLNYRMNPTPDVAARRAISRAERAQSRAEKADLPQGWRGELDQAGKQLDDARTAYGKNSFDDALNLAVAARSRFEALAGAGETATVGAGQFHSVDGRVSVQHSGQSDWMVAKPKMPVFNGDFVKTDRRGSAEILFADGTLFHIAPNSLLEIHHQDTASDEAGAVKMVVGRVNVTTGRSSSTVATDSLETRIERDSRVAVDVTEETEETTVSAYLGHAVVENTAGQQRRVATRQQVSASAEGAFSETRVIPKPPVPIDPVNNAGFDLRTKPVIVLRWSLPSPANGIKLQVSQSKSFPTYDLDVDSPVLSGETAKLQAVHPGTYFWRVASVHDDNLMSEWSTIRRFRIYSPEHQQVIRDLEPPDLELSPVRQLGHTFIVEGSTEPGATVTINGAHVETDSHGGFRKAVEVHRIGWNDIIIRSTDPSGNHIERRERVYLEEY